MFHIIDTYTYYKPATSETYTEEFANYVVVGSTAQGKTELVKEYEYKDLPAGTYWVCAEIIDAAGNSIVTDTIYVETLEVTPGDEGVEVTKDNNNWTNEEVTVHINKKDDRYEILTSTNGEDWTNNTEYTFEENGSVFIKLTDGINEGEVYEYKVTNIDKENPQAQINQKEVTSKSFTVNADITDNASGLGQIKWYYKNEADAEYTEVVQDYQVIKGPDAGELNTSKELKVDNLVKGTYKVYAVVVDVAGNEITTNEITIVLETITAGEDALTFTPNTQNWTNQPVTVTLTNSDERYEIETSTNGTEWNRTNTATLTENGTVYGRLTDGVNSGEISTIDINNIDVTPIEGSLESKDVTSKSLTVQANITDNASGLAEIEWYFKKDTDTEYTKTIENYQTIGGAESGELSTSKDITYDNLTSGKYQIYAIVTDVAGNKTTLDQIEVTLTVITAGEAGIEFISSNENWTNQNITMTVNSTDERYTVLTSTDNASWSPATEIEFSANGTIYARLTDGINQGTVTSREVTNIDKEPLVANVTNADVASRNFTQKIDITDNLSGLGKVEIYYKEPTDESYEVFETVYQAINGSVSGETATSKNITVDGLTTGTYKTYAVITDVAGNKTTTGTINAITNTAPTMGTVTFNSKTTNSITVRATATDRDGDNLTYTLYVSTSLNGSYTPNGTATGASGSAVTLTATGLSQYTTYYYYVHVTDTIATAQSSKGQNVRTYCPGTGLTCTTEACSGTQITTCTTCDGNGEVSERCTDGYTDTCSRCDGSGETSSRCPGGSSRSCSKCGGDGKIACTGSVEWFDGASGAGTCPKCGGELAKNVFRCSDCGARSTETSCASCSYTSGSSSVNHKDLSCSSCGGEGIITSTCIHGEIDSHTVYEECSRCDGTGEIDHECEHGYTSSHTYYDECSRCNGIGTITTTPCIHGYSSAHRHCEHFETTTAVTHQYCSHGETSQHD